VLLIITIVTDSSAYFKKDKAAELGVQVIPLTYTVDEWKYNESFGDCNGDFEVLLRGNAKFTTSQPNPAAFLSCFEEASANGSSVLCITISSRLSGAYSTAYMAAKQTGNKNIAVFDSHLTAGGLYLLIKQARRLIDKGFSLPEIMQKLPDIREKISIAFSVDDMAPLRNSGRIGFVRMSVGTILNVKPILLCKDGAVVSDSVARGNTELIKKLVQKIPKNAVEAVINYIGENREVAVLYHAIKSAYPNIELKLQKVGPVLGIHLGLRVMAISVLREL
jgi:DegV family protein with EDD domain